MSFERQPWFRRNQSLEEMLQHINGLLQPVESGIISGYKSPRYPTVLIVGCARSGSTLLLQWLANLGVFAYPTNLLSRFYAAPYVGALIQRLLTDPAYNFNNEILDFNSPIDFRSNLGKTQGALAPNEFWYFWRRFFEFDELQELSPDALARVPIDDFVAELAALEHAFRKPLAMKAMILNWHLPFLAQALEKVLFLHIKREPLYNAQSLLEARQKYYGDTHFWYSFKPPEFQLLKDLEPHQQVAGQVFFTNAAIERGLKHLPAAKWLAVSYEDFCAAPESTYRSIRQRMEAQGYNLPDFPGSLESFATTNQERLPAATLERIAAALEAFSADNPSLVSEGS